MKVWLTGPLWSYQLIPMITVQSCRKNFMSWRWLKAYFGVMCTHSGVLEQCWVTLPQNFQLSAIMLILHKDYAMVWLLTIILWIRCDTRENLSSLVGYQYVYTTVLPTTNLSFRNYINIGDTSNWFISNNILDYSCTSYLHLHFSTEHDSGAT